MSQKQVSHPKHARSKVQAPREDKMPKNDRGWGGAGAVGWGVLGAFGSMEKDTGAQVVKRGQPSNFKMVKDEKGLWVKVRVDAPGAGGRGGGIPVMGGEGESAFGGLQNQEDGYGYDDRRRGEKEDAKEDRDRNRKPSSRRSRSHSRGRDRGADRRSSRRSRSRSRSRDRKSSRRRSRSYSRERERGRERRRQRSVSSSRGRDRDERRRRRSPSSTERGRRKEEDMESERRAQQQQQQEEEEERRRQQREKEDEATTHEKAAAPLPPSPAPPPPNPEEMSWTAAQLADRLVGIYNTSHPKRYDHIAACFQPDVSLCVLKSGQAVVKGVERLRDSMPSDFARREAKCTRRLLLLSDDPADPSFALDFYPAGHAPGMQAFGKGNTPLDTILLFEAAPGPKNRIRQVWIAPDVKGLATAERVTELDVLSSKAFAHAAAAVKARMKAGATTRQHFHDYRNMETIG